MNAAAKQINRSNFFHGELATMKFSFSMYFQTILLVLLLVSALSVIYITNLQRMTFSQLEMAEQKTNLLQLHWGQLLLEQASMGTPSRVEQLAYEKLHMVLPTDKQTFILRVQ